MKDWIKDLNEEELKRLYRDDAALKNVPTGLNARVLTFIRDQKAPPSPRQTAHSRLKPALIIAAAAAVVTTAFFIVRPLFMPSGGEVVIARSAVPDHDLARGDIGPNDDQALVVFSAGEVTVRRDAAWKSVELGGYLGRGARIKVGASSSCELQFGDRALVRLGERTELLVEQLSTRAGRTDIELYAETGSVLSKVSRLFGGETYRIKTKTAACGVRGTLFSVSVKDNGETTISVKEGGVYFLPVAADPGDLKRGATKNNNALAARFDRLKDKAPFVPAGKEIVLTAAYTVATASAADTFGKGVDAILSSRPASEKDAARLDGLIDSFLTGLQPASPAARPLSRDATEALTPLQQTEYLPVSLDPARAEKALPALARFVLTTEPDDAAIRLAGRPVGKGRFQGIFRQDERLEFGFRRPGYEDGSLSVIVRSGMPPMAIVLNKLHSQPPSVNTIVPPTASPTAKATPTPVNVNPLDFNDDFNSVTLNPRWKWVRGNSGNWSLQKKPGRLTITTQMGEIREAEADAQNILLCPVPPGDFQLDTKVDFKPQTNYQQAGLIVYSNDDSYIKLDYVSDTDLKFEMADEDSGMFTTKLFPYKIKTATYYLRIIRKGETYSGYFSEDGKNYTLVKAYSRSWTNNLRAGLWAVNGAGNYSLNDASFDYFRLAYDR